MSCWSSRYWKSFQLIKVAPIFWIWLPFYSVVGICLLKSTLMWETNASGYIKFGIVGCIISRDVPFDVKGQKMLDSIDWNRREDQWAWMISSTYCKCTNCTWRRVNSSIAVIWTDWFVRSQFINLLFFNWSKFFTFFVEENFFLYEDYLLLFKEGIMHVLSSNKSSNITPTNHTISTNIMKCKSRYRYRKQENSYK